MPKKLSESTTSKNDINMKSLINNNEQFKKLLESLTLENLSNNKSKESTKYESKSNMVVSKEGVKLKINDNSSISFIKPQPLLNFNNKKNKSIPLSIDTMYNMDENLDIDKCK
jgi:hypothetical protein